MPDDEEDSISTDHGPSTTRYPNRSTTSFVVNSHLFIALLGAVRLYWLSQTYFSSSVTTSPLELLVDLMLFAFPFVAFYQYRGTRGDERQLTIVIAGVSISLIISFVLGRDPVASLLGVTPACMWAGLAVSTVYHDVQR